MKKLIKLTIEKRVAQDVKDTDNNVLYKANDLYQKSAIIIKSDDLDYYTKPRIDFIEVEKHNKAIPFLVKYIYIAENLTTQEEAMVEEYMEKHIKNEG